MSSGGKGQGGERSKRRLAVRPAEQGRTARHRRSEAGIGKGRGHRRAPGSAGPNTPPDRRLPAGYGAKRRCATDLWVSRCGRVVLRGVRCLRCRLEDGAPARRLRRRRWTNHPAKPVNAPCRCWTCSRRAAFPWLRSSSFATPTRSSSFTRPAGMSRCRSSTSIGRRSRLGSRPSATGSPSLRDSGNEAGASLPGQAHRCLPGLSENAAVRRTTMVWGARHHICRCWTSASAQRSGAAPMRKQSIQFNSTRLWMHWWRLRNG